MLVSLNIKEKARQQRSHRAHPNTYHRTKTNVFMKTIEVKRLIEEINSRIEQLYSTAEWNTAQGEDWQARRRLSEIEVLESLRKWIDEQDEN